ncbi:hypothetical protein FPZ54_08355 [Sphingomonas suaedae]|uniref:Uncharacterized protein n=1 Tax=Sphingomonas suaedae TaxID=2599297 RepID=A0A518RF00_9SPHN|nr:hypothetical protein [Sphingomonas suaedae]QDX26035.1 hypothetical protein FPZ54_08355 [Sphingomonas suaedae]
MRGNSPPKTASSPDETPIGTWLGPVETRRLERLVNELRGTKGKKGLKKGTITTATTLGRTVEYVDVDA